MGSPLRKWASPGQKKYIHPALNTAWGAPTAGDALKHLFDMSKKTCTSRILGKAEGLICKNLYRFSLRISHKSKGLEQNSLGNLLSR
jgi:hypothetical protein